MDALVDITEAMHIDAPPETVWQLITDVRRHPEFGGPKSITKVIDFDGPLEVGQRWIAHEKFGPQKFDAPSDITDVDPLRRFAWVSFPPFKEERRGAGGRVFWSYEITPEGAGSRLAHRMQVIPPEKGAAGLKLMYAVFNMPKRQRAGIQTSLRAIRQAAEAVSAPAA
jgi:uncharacterized protein YndB with AHSA1/START domain